MKTYAPCPAILTLGLLLLATMAALGQAEVPGTEGLILDKGGRPSFFADNALVLALLGAIVIGTISVLGHLYWRDWQSKRRLQQYLNRPRPGSLSDVAPTTTPPRKSLIAGRVLAANGGQPAAQTPD